MVWSHWAATYAIETTLTTTTSPTSLTHIPGDKNIYLPLVMAHVLRRGDIVSLPEIQQQLGIPKSLTHWLRLKTWQDFMQQVNNYKLKKGENSVLIRIIGGVGIGRFLAQMGSASHTPMMKQRQHVARRKKHHTPIKNPSSRLLYYNVSIGRRRMVMTIEKDKYVSKNIIDRGTYDIS